MTKEYINRIISILYRYNQRFFAQKLEEYSLPVEVGQLPTLIQIYKYPGITQDGISSNVGIDKGTVARTVNQLEHAGMVIRRTDEKDRRINHIFATPKGMEYRIYIFQIIEDLHEVLYQGFCGSKIEEAISMLERMKSNIDNVFKL
ncbi:MAG TPA: MarR family winged helix-turn-helix transcriptional regulator [Bacillota bacterium]|nr:MarR family winged helix-turn-helix transcriptional regulator [Bacillota bacterium]HPL53788.1 MarR family winged helix-turn-helix transcriptional regulator [Bacillota bacterium]